MKTTESPRERALRFVRAAEQLRTTLERRYHTELHSLGDVLHNAKVKKDPVIQQNRNTLRVLKDLRNVIQHDDSFSGEPIAVPQDNAIEKMEQLAALVDKQPPVRDFMTTFPHTLTPTSTFRDAATDIVTHDLSQVPVYEHVDGKDNYLGLFTTNAMARWLSASIEEDNSLLALNITVSDAMEYAEEYEYGDFIKPTTPALEVCRLLTKQDAPLAILVTTDGTPAGQLRGIVTRFDVAGILRAVTVQYP